MPEIVDIIDDEMEIVEEENRSVMSVNLGELTLDSTLHNGLTLRIGSTPQTLAAMFI